MEVFNNERDLYICVNPKERVYALNAAHMDSVFEIHDKIGRKIRSNQYISEILPPGDIISLLDLRKLFGIESIEKNVKGIGSSPVDVTAV